MRGCLAVGDALILGVLAAALFILGSVAAIKTAAHIYEGTQAQNWPTTSGRIVALETETEGVEDSRNITTVRYTYTVNGQLYQGSRIHPNYSRTDSCCDGKRLIALKDNASLVLVYYHPENPAQSTLTAGYFRASVISLALCFTTCLIGVGFALLSIGSRQQDIVASINVKD